MNFNIADLFESIADAIPQKEALIAGERRLTYAQLDERATQLANFLRRNGVRAGDHVGLYLYNGSEYLEGMLAAFKIRAVPVNINYRYVEDELKYLFNNADLAALLHQSELAARVDAVAPSVPTLKLRLASGADYEAALAGESPKRDFAERSGGDIYMIYTGGTTGLPRGVMWRQEDVFFAGLQGGNAGGDPLERPEELAPLAASGDKALTFMPCAPFIHGAAQWAAFIGLFGGGKVVVHPGPSFDARAAARAIEREQVNTVTLVGDAMARPLAEAIEELKPDTASLIVIASAGAILSPSVKDHLQSLLPAAMVINSFGASETGHQGTAFGEGHPSGTGSPSAQASPGQGRPKFMMSDNTAVLDDSGQPCAPGVPGRLARSGRVPLGYYKDEKKTAATFLTVADKRWVVPGDMAVVDEDGLITVLGRGAVCINSGGEKIYPEEVEEALKAHPQVFDAVVVGVPDARWGERVAALVQPRAGMRPELAELSAHLRTKIAGYKIPRELHLVDAMVRHPSGKPDYRWARQEALSQNDGWQLDRVQAGGGWAEQRRLAGALRKLVEECITLDAPADEVRQIVAVIEEQAARLAALQHKSSRDAFLDGTYGNERARFLDRSPLIGLSNPLAPPMTLRPEGEIAVGELSFGPVHEGAPGWAHGGMVAAAFDQVFGYLGVLRDRPALTGSLTIRYRKPTPIGVRLRFEAQLESANGRKSTVKGRLVCDGEVLAEAEALFVQVEAEKFTALVGAG